jgi:hypothetical protein
MVVTITSSMLFSGLYSGTTINAQTVDSAKPSQYNQLDFEPPIAVPDLKDIFKKNYKNLTSVTVVGEYVTDFGYSIPLRTEYTVGDDNKAMDSLKSVSKQLADQLKTAKADASKPKQKFDSKELLKAMSISSSSVGSKISANTQPSNAIPTAEELKYYEDNGYLPPIKVDEAKLKQAMKGTELEGKTISHLDPALKGKLPNPQPLKPNLLH